MPNQNNHPATKNDLKKLEQSTKNDFKKLDFKIDGVTKSLKSDIKRLDTNIDGIERSLRNEIRISIKETEELQDEKAQKYRNQILTKMDNF